jgi:deoxycytidylate deaminase
MTHEILKCEYCDGYTRGDTCYKAVGCPSCSAKVGQSCVRPSGHKASRIHADRVALAQYVDDQKGFDWQTAYADLLKRAVS